MSNRREREPHGPWLVTVRFSTLSAVVVLVAVVCVGSKLTAVSSGSTFLRPRSRPPGF